MNFVLLKENIGSKVVILGHHNADPDAIGAAVGVKELFTSLAPNSEITIIMPGDISKLSRTIITSLDLDIFEEYAESFDTLVLVDTGSLNQLDDWEDKTRNVTNLVVIDHHSRNNEIQKLADVYIVDEEASSTSEIVHGLIENYGMQLTDKTVKALLAGIIFDSKFLSIGSSATFHAVSKLLESIEDISQVRNLFSSGYPMSEKIARMKAAQRMNYHRINGWLVVFSELGSFQSSGARGLISLGADVAIVTGREKKLTRSSLRSTNQFYSKTGVHLGELIGSISVNVDGEGSGHPTAAGFNGNCSVDEFNNLILENLRNLLSVKN